MTSISYFGNKSRRMHFLVASRFLLDGESLDKFQDVWCFVFQFISNYCFILHWSCHVEFQAHAGVTAFLILRGWLLQYCITLMQKNFAKFFLQTPKIFSEFFPRSWKTLRRLAKNYCQILARNLKIQEFSRQENRNSKHCVHEQPLVLTQVLKWQKTVATSFTLLEKLFKFFIQVFLFKSYGKKNMCWIRNERSEKRVHVLNSRKKTFFGLAGAVTPRRTLVSNLCPKVLSLKPYKIIRWPLRDSNLSIKKCYVWSAGGRLWLQFVSSTKKLGERLLRNYEKNSGSKYWPKSFRYKGVNGGQN